MVGNALEQDIIGLYSDNISSLYSINQIATKLGKKYPYINKKVTTLVKSRIFKKIVVGRSHLCSLNLENDETVYLLILNEIQKKKKFLESHPKAAPLLEYTGKIARISPAGIILKAKNSILFVVDKADEKESLEKTILTQALQGHECKVIAKDEFQALLLENEKLHEDHIILHGFEKYYSSIKEIEDELKIRYSKLTP